ncbi:MAG: MvaI/BcnI family restriction endonuclease [Prevotellaceae bacterium]|nr:MvaI/BcnI family restriction endonuclease [Prevotellaceae bacterium]
MTIQEFANKFKEIKALDFVPTMRKGTTGSGYTLETLLDISENNFASPDIEGAELKAHL